MVTTKFEDTYSCVETAKTTTADLPALAEVLMTANRPMTCREVGITLFGDAYIRMNTDTGWKHDQHSRCLERHTTQMLRHFVRGGFVSVEEVDGEPVEIEREEYRRVDDYGQPQYIRVHDDEGNEYQMPNPKYNSCYGKGEWITVKKTIIPKVRVYTWVA